MQSIKGLVKNLEKRLNELKQVLNLDKKKTEAEELEQKSLEKDFWKNQEKAQKLMQNLSQLKSEINDIEEIDNKLKDFKEMARVLEGIQRNFILSINYNPDIRKTFKRFKLKKGSKLLEIGYGRGEFLERFKELGFECTGI